MPFFKRHKSEETYHPPPPRAAAAAAPGVAAPARVPAKSSLTGPAPNTAGPHKHDFMNRLDPAVDSKAGLEPKTRRRGSAPAQAQAQASGITYPAGVAGPAPTTAGPHRHDFMNKLDPSVDSRPGETGQKKQ